MFRSKIERLESTLGVNGFNDEMLEAAYSMGPYKGNGSVYQTQTVGFNLDETDDQNMVILNTS